MMASIALEGQAEGIVENPGIMSDSDPGTDNEGHAESEEHDPQQEQQQVQEQERKSTDEDIPSPRRRRSSAADAFAEAAQARRMSYQDLDGEIQRRRISNASRDSPDGNTEKSTGTYFSICNTREECAR